MCGVKLISLHIEKSNVLYSLYLSIFIQETYSFATTFALFYFSCKIFWYGKVFPNQNIRV